MITIKVVLRKSKISEAGLAPLYLRITKNRKVSFLSLQLFVKPSDWDEKTSRIKKSHPNSVRLNAIITEKYAEAERVSLDLITKRTKHDPANLKEKLVKKESGTFAEFAASYLDRFEKMSTVGSFRRVKAVLSKFQTFLNDGNKLLTDFTLSTLKEYEEFMSVTLNNRTNTIMANFKVLRRLFNEAEVNDLIESSENPFKRFKGKSEPTRRHFLIQEEISLLEALELKENSMMYHHRNMFVFACYTGGIRVSDLLQLTWNSFDGVNLTFKITKTKRPISIKVPDKGLSILRIYQGSSTKSTDRVFPLLKVNGPAPVDLHNAISSATAYLNRDLKTLARLAGIDKNLSFHVSRHTFATLALKKGIRIEYVSKLLGHADIKETQIYAKVMNTELDKAMDVFNS